MKVRFVIDRQESISNIVFVVKIFGIEIFSSWRFLFAFVLFRHCIERIKGGSVVVLHTIDERIFIRADNVQSMHIFSFFLINKYKLMSPFLCNFFYMYINDGFFTSSSLFSTSDHHCTSCYFNTRPAANTLYDDGLETCSVLCEILLLHLIVLRNYSNFLRLS